jgi:hypothetical protein
MHTMYATTYIAMIQRNTKHDGKGYFRFLEVLSTGRRLACWRYVVSRNESNYGNSTVTHKVESFRLW